MLNHKLEVSLYVILALAGLPLALLSWQEIVMSPAPPAMGVDTPHKVYVAHVLPLLFRYLIFMLRVIVTLTAWLTLRHQYGARLRAIAWLVFGIITVYVPMRIGYESHLIRRTWELSFYSALVALPLLWLSGRAKNERENAKTIGSRSGESA